MVYDLVRVFPADATEFTTNGLGVLSEATKCTVTEEANGAFELELEYPVWGKHFNDLVARNLIVAKPRPYGAAQAFRIYAVSKPINKLVTFNAQHISYDLSGYPVTPFEASSCAEAMNGLKSHSLKSHNFTFWTDKQTSATFKIEVPSSTRSMLGGTEGSILDTYHGDYEFDNFNIKLFNKRGMDRGVVIRYGKNMTDFTQEENIANVYTSVYPYWKGRVKDEEGNEEEEDTLFELPERTVDVDNGYSFINVLVQDFSSDFEEIPTAEQLRDYTKAWIKENNIGVPDVSFEVSFFQLSQSVEYKDLALLEQIELFDTVSVEFIELNVSAKATVNKIVYNALTGRYDTISLGSVRASISDSIISNEQNIADSEVRTNNHLEQAVENATKWITNGRGYMVAVKDEAGNWMEICSLDVPSINEAQSVWRWNNGGFGHSSTGYNGPYRTAITQDGHIVADFIDTGSLNATVIKTGILQDYSGDIFFLDLDNGILRMKPTNLFIGNSNLEEELGSIQDKFDTVDKNLDKWYDDAIQYADQVANGAKEYADGIVDDAQKAQEAEWKAAIANSMLQENIFKALTDNGKIEGLVMRDGQLYVNASYIASGVYVVGGYNNVSGVIKVRNASQKDLIILDNQGITLDPICKISWANISGAPDYALKTDLKSDQDLINLIDKNKGTIITDEYISSLYVVADAIAAGTKITVGGANNANGEIYVKNGSGSNLVILNNQGITLDSSCKISWSNISGAPNYALKSDLKSDSELINLIKNNRGTIITEDYIGSMYIVADAIAANMAIIGHNITVGGTNNTNGSITVKNSSGTTIVTINNQGIVLSGGYSISWSSISGAPTIPTKTSQLTNDSSYAKSSDIPTKTSQLTNNSGFAYTSNIPTKVSQLTNDKNYATTSQIPTVPTKLSQLANDMNFATNSSIPSDSEIVDLIIAKRSTIITKDYIASLKVVAGSVVSGTITSSTINGGTLNGTTGTFSGDISAATGTFTGKIKSDGTYGSARIAEGLLKIFYNDTKYSEYGITGNSLSNFNVGKSVAGELTGQSRIVYHGTMLRFLTNTPDALFVFGSTIYSEFMSNYKTYFYTDVNIGGDFYARGTKNRIADTDNYEQRLLYCYETPSPLFGDIGEAVTDENGECYLFLDDVFTETVSTEIEYQVFLQKEGPGDIWISEKTPKYFVVKGTPNLKFAWEIKAKQKSYEYERLEKFDNRNDQEINYEDDYIDEYNSLIENEEAMFT